MIDQNRIQYEPEMKEWALKAIDRIRPVVFLGPRQLAGQRFNDNARVLAALESMTPQANFEKFPLVSVEDALKECASADYWYEREKDFGCDTGTDGSCDNAEEGCQHGYNGR